jgi:predicted AlkP superfamily phosphohydrolase/phosphomutase
MRFWLIGFDGMEPALAERWMDEARLPHLARLRAEGVFLRCASTRPPVTYPAWTTCVTGVNPGRHGIFDFTEVVPGERSIRFTNSSYRRAPALWNALSEQGKRCCVLSVPGTYPPESVNGIMISGFDSPVATSVDASFVYPRELYPEVRGWRFADFQESDIGPGWHARALELLLAKIEDKERIALSLLDREPWDFFMAVFGESDTVSHHFWLFHDPQSPRHRAGFETAIRQVYERLDETLGKVLERPDGDTIVGVVSDHGFGGAGTGVVHLNNWLAERGHLQFSGGGGSLLKQAALRIAPQRMRGALFRRFQGLATRAEGQSRFGGIDWANTRAWSEELNYFPNIRVNLKGRDPEGQVKAADYAAYVRDLCAELEAWEPIAHAWPRAELFDGPEVDRAPDIIIELALEDGYSHSCLRARGGPAFRRIRPEEALGGKERGMNGNHRDPGVLFLNRPCGAESASLLDLAPTVLAALGMAAPPMEGRALLGGSVENAEAAVPGERAPYTAEQEKMIEDRLRALGYFE